MLLVPAFLALKNSVKELKERRSAEKVVCLMQKMKLCSRAFDKLEEVAMSSRDSDARRMGGYAVLWEGVYKSIVDTKMRMIGSFFMTWHIAASKRREHVLANKGLRQWQKQAISHAWECWYEQHANLVRLRTLSTWILKRLSSRATVTAMARWQEHRKDERRHKNIIFSAIRRRQIMCLAPTMTLLSVFWSMKKMLLRTLEKIMLRWQHLVLAEAYSSWNDHVKEKELLQKERGLEEMALRMRNAGMLKVLASWLKNAIES